MNIKKLSIIALASLVLLSGCSSNKQEDEEKLVENATVTPVNEMTEMSIMGSISEIDIDNNTLTITSMNRGMKDFDGQIPSEGEVPQEMPEDKGDFDPEQKGEFNPEDLPEGMKDFNPEDMPIDMAGAESKTYKLLDSTVIKDANDNDISINDLNVGDFVSYTVEDENILTITIANMDAMPNRDVNNQ